MLLLAPAGVNVFCTQCTAADSVPNARFCTQCTAGTGFLCMLPSFRSAMPGLTPAPLAASVLLFLPFIRDVLSWSGFRQVSRATFVRALHEQVRMQIVGNICYKMGFDIE